MDVREPVARRFGHVRFDFARTRYMDLNRSPNDVAARRGLAGGARGESGCCMGRCDRTDEGPSLYLPGDGVGSLLYVYSVGHSAPPRDEHDGGQRSCWNGQRRDPQPILQSEEVSDSA